MTHDGAYLIVIPFARWHVAANAPPSITFNARAYLMGLCLSAIDTR